MSHIPRRAGALLLLALALAPAPLLALATHDTEASRAVSSHTPRAAGTIRGRVVDAESGQPVMAAQIAVVGTTLGALTNNDGNFTIAGVTAGQVTVRATRIGYQPQTMSVTVTDDAAATANFTLARAAARLEEVVTTATGEQSRREMGNVVATIRADSITKTAPITNVNEMLQARTSGVQIIQGQGVIGASSSIRIRGTSSLSLSNEPLIVVDGIRFDNSAEPGNTSAGVRINRFSSMDPEEIETIDIIKGPSASALYGTAAANGVIVISTKRGRSGSPRWSGFVEGGATNMPAKYPANYKSWGHNLNSAGQVVGGNVQCKLANFAQKFCTIDSLTSYNPWTAPESNPYKNGPTQQYGLQVSGGADALKYFLSVTRLGEIGPYNMPAYEVNRITKARGVAPRSEQKRPNQLHQTSVRGSFSFPIGKNANVDISTGYSDRDLWTPFDGTFFAGLANQLLSAPGNKTATNGTAREFVGDIFSVNQRLTLERFTGSSQINWAPISWLTLTAQGGVDNANSNNYQIQLPGEGTINGSAWGPTASQGYSGVDIFRTNSLQYTVTGRAAATRKITDAIGSQTTLGAQWFKSGEYRLFGEGYGLGVGATTPTAAQQRLASTTTTESATYGWFAQEQLNFFERIYWTIGMRADQNSAFGRNVGTTIYPSSSLSYVISEEGWFPHLPLMDRLRLRASVGQAGLPPGTTAALSFLQTLTYPSATGDDPGLTLQSIGLSGLKPEITTEVEGGFDLGLANERVNVEFTVFNKTSKDQLFQAPLPLSYGVGLGTQWVNIAKVRNAGQELAIDAQLLQHRLLAWNMRLNGSHLGNKLIDIGKITLAAPQGVRNVVGYPLFGLWDRPYTFKDADNDGIIVPSEITLADKDKFRGSTLPLYEAGMSNTFGFFNNRVTVSGLVDYRGKFWNSYTIGSNRAVSAGNAPEVNVKGSPLEDQAAAVAASTAALKNTRWGIFKPNDFIKLREVSVAFNAPESFASRYLRSRTAQLVLSGRNLATLWTKYPGLDPEANRSVNNTGGGNDDLGTPPALRYYTARINLAF